MPSLASFSILCILTASVQAIHVEVHPRQANESITFTIEPSPTITATAVVAAYSDYAAACGTDLDVIAYSALPDYIQETGPMATNATILDQGFQEFLESNDDDWAAGEQACNSASSALDGAILAASTSSGALSSGSKTSLHSGSSSGNQATQTQPPAIKPVPATTTSTVIATGGSNAAVGVQQHGRSLMVVICVALVGQMTRM
ncbi:hypothetical protein DFH07DRAFT_592358 [Mycena maculata]|uniref:Uncharacterized protein n=1 Tax=Mycena maculata TaxID=230809 RepID=A0AAD7IPK4_9AGAR|nr:hypothetical protein DFH07DRAFT_592358 [Mycena maculata]